MTQKRDQYTIARDILNMTKHGARITKIVYGTNLNFNVADRYLGQLENNGLVKSTFVGRSRMWITTEKGLMFAFCMESVLAIWDGGMAPFEGPEVTTP